MTEGGWVSDNSGVRLGVATKKEIPELGLDLGLDESLFINVNLRKVTRIFIHVKNQSNKVISRVKVKLSKSPHVITRSRSYGTLNNGVIKNRPFDVIPREMGVINLRATLKSIQGHRITLPIVLKVYNFVYFPIRHISNVLALFYCFFVEDFDTGDIKCEEVIEIYDFEYFVVKANYALALLNYVKGANIRHDEVLGEQNVYRINKLIKNIHGLLALFKEKNKNPDNYKEFLNNSILEDSNMEI